MRVDALQKYRNQLLSEFNVESMQALKRSNWSGMLEDTDRLYATMYHDWDVLQKDSNDLAEAVQTLDWTVAPYVADGEEATPEAQAVAKVVTDALWKRSTQKPGSFGHSFTQLLGALVHGKFRGFNVHEVEWKFDGDMWFPAMFHQLPAQFMRWEYEAGKPDRLLFVPDGETEEPRPFPDNKFIVALNTTGPDHPLYNATYYPLIAWFGAFKFGLGWFMEYCQKYGLPKLVFHYESESDRRQLEQDLSEEKVLNNILLKGDRAVDIANAPASGASLPQRELLNLAESACHKLILGQTLTSDTSENGGSLAQAKVHAGVQADVVRKTADYVADVLNTQLIPTIVLLNYGTTDVPMPELRAKIPQEGVTQERVQVVKTALEIKGMKLKKSEVYEFTGFSQPADDDDVFEAAQEPQQGGGGFPFGQEPPPGGDEPQKGQQEPEEGNEEESSEEPVSAAKSNTPADPAQNWLAPLKKELLEARKNGASLADLRKKLVSMRPDTKALARAFANNILAGLSGEDEKVKAENRFGCNQYGEGWAEPHNGLQSKPGAPMKKGDPTPATKKAEEAAVKKAEEEAARKEAIAKQKAEEAAKKEAEAEAARKAEEEKRKAEEAKRAEEEAKKAEEEAKKAEAERAERIKAAKTPDEFIEACGLSVNEDASEEQIAIFMRSLKNRHPENKKHLGRLFKLSNTKATKFDEKKIMQVYGDVVSMMNPEIVRGLTSCSVHVKDLPLGVAGLYTPARRQIEYSRINTKETIMHEWIHHVHSSASDELYNKISDYFRQRVKNSEITKLSTGSKDEPDYGYVDHFRTSFDKTNDYAGKVYFAGEDIRVDGSGFPKRRARKDNRNGTEFTTTHLEKLMYSKNRFMKYWNDKQDGKYYWREAFVTCMKLFFEK